MSKDNLIYVLNKRLGLHQAPDGFRTSMDSVMLAASCPAASGENILDLGCGVGSVGLCVLKRVDDTILTGIDIQGDHIAISKKNGALNDMAERAEFFEADVRTADFGTFDHVVCNPPYLDAGAHIHSPSISKARAMGYIEQDVSIQDWIDCAFHHIKGQGSLTIIHEAGQSDDIIHALYGKNGGKRFGNVELFPLYPKQDAPAKRIIIRAWKHKKSPTILYSGLIMHESNGDYSKGADNILRDMGDLF